MHGAVDGHRERRLVTCLFVDIVGSTETTLRLAPEQAERLLGDAFDRLSSIVARRVGSSRSTSATPSARSSVRRRPVPMTRSGRCLRPIAAPERGRTRPPCGRARRSRRCRDRRSLVDLDAIDDRQRIAVGACVNTAARLQQHAEPGETLVGPGCHAAAAARGRFERGRDAEPEGHRRGGHVAPDRGPRTGSGRGAIRRARSRAVALEDATRRARDGTATLAFIIGPPGQGKSRLAAEAIRHAAPSQTDRGPVPAGDRGGQQHAAAAAPRRRCSGADPRRGP